MQTHQTLEKYEMIQEKEVSEALEIAISLVKHNLAEFTNQFPGPASEKNFYIPEENHGWTTGFLTGELWLSYEHTKESCFMDAALIQVDSFYNRIKNKIDVDHHDMGFLYSPSCVAAYQLTGNQTAKEAAILAADQLMSRFQERGQFFQAWGKLGAVDNYRLIIDCLMNMPLLFWASKETGNKEYEVKAQAHIKTAMKCLLRPDHSAYHTFYFDKETGEPLKGVTCQGNRDGSAWARGQAWGIYGSALAYRYLRNDEYVTKFKDITDYFIRHLPNDLVPFWDFDFDDGSDEPRDSSSAAIAVCGMLEMSAYLEREDADYYIKIARKILKSLKDLYAVTDKSISNGLLLHATYSKTTPYNTCNNHGVDECNIWGDYFYLEALIHFSHDWKSYW